MFRSLTMIALGVMLLACTQQAAQNYHRDPTC